MKKQISIMNIAAAAVKIAVVVMAAVFVVMLSGCSGKKKTVIDFEKCVSVEFSGYNGEGRAVISPDTGYIFSLLGDMNTLTAAELVSSFEIEPAANSNSSNGKLSNGDKFEIKVSTDERMLKNVNVGVKNTSLSFTVSGLKDKPKADIFADVSLSVSGASPYCEVNVNYSGSLPLNQYSFVIDDGERKKYKDGDAVTVTLHENSLNVLSGDYVIEETSREFVVKANSRFILTNEDISTESTTRLKKTVQEYLDGKLAELRANTDKGSFSRVISSVSGINIGSLAASTCYIKDIENVSFDSAYVGTVTENGWFGSVNVYKYAYFFYEADVSYFVSRAFQNVDTTSHGILIVRISDLTETADGLTYSAIELQSGSELEAAVSSRIGDTFSKLDIDL